MKKNLLMLIVFFLIGGTVVFAQESSNSGPEGITAQTPWYYKLEIAAGFQMGFLTEEDASWTTYPAGFVGFRHYLKPVFRSLVLGYSIFGRFSYPNERVWIPPDGQPIKFTRDNTDLRYGLGGFAGASLQARMFGPVGVVLDIGLIGNVEIMRGYYSLSPQYQDQRYNNFYNIFDLGIGLNCGPQLNLGRFTIEAGANLGYSFLRSDVYQVRDTANDSNKVDSDHRNGVTNIIRAAPYIMFSLTM